MNDVTRPLRDAAYRAEAIMHRAAESGQYHYFDPDVKHTFHGGIYAREIEIPEGCILTGKIHKYDNMNMLVEGTMRFIVDDENNFVELHGPSLVCAPSGVKRLAYAVTKSRWVTFLPTHETDPHIVERLFIVQTEEEYQNFLRLSQAERQGCLS